ncbi:beta strand repeat-containing protein, partial [Polynucleobacter asymbioticus]
GGILNQAGGVIYGNTNSLDLQNITNAFTVDNYGTLIGNANIGINTLNIDSPVAVVAGGITGTGALNINPYSGFGATARLTTQGDIDVGSVNLNPGGTLNLANNITTSGGVNNAGVLNLIPTNAGGTSTAIITGADYTQSGQLNAGITANAGVFSTAYLSVTGNATFTSGAGVGIAPGFDLLQSRSSAPTPYDNGGTFTANSVTTPIIISTNALIGVTPTTSGIYTYDGLSTQYQLINVNSGELDLSTTGTVTGYDNLSLTGAGTTYAGTTSHYFGVTIDPNVTVGRASTDAYGIAINSGGSINGSINNSGTVQGTIAGIYIANNSTLGGTLGGAIVNNAGALISGGNYGIQVTDASAITNGITNAGTITGNNTGIAISNYS